MGKTVWSYVAALPLLEPVVADLAGGVERFLDVTRLHNVSRPIGMMRPDAS